VRGRDLGRTVEYADDTVIGRERERATDQTLVAPSRECEQARALLGEHVGHGARGQPRMRTSMRDLGEESHQLTSALVEVDDAPSGEEALAQRGSVPRGSRRASGLSRTRSRLLLTPGGLTLAVSSADSVRCRTESQGRHLCRPDRQNETDPGCHLQSLTETPVVSTMAR
jgi:hypothetical protein